MTEITTEEYLNILTELDNRHGVFYHLWDMGKPRFTEEIPTAAVLLNEEGNCVDFMLGEKFWKSLNLEQKLFVICHECLHVTLNHGHRLFANAKSKDDAKAMNFATDIVINHTLIDKFNMDRAVIDPNNLYCWVDTVFPNIDIPEGKSSEFYYKKIQEQIENNEFSPQGGGSGERSVDTVDEHSPQNGDSFDDMSEVMKELNDRLDDNEKDFIKDIIDSNKELDNSVIQDNYTSQTAGTSPGNMFTTIDTSEKVKKKRKWETVIKQWSQKYLRQSERDEFQWARVNRRFALINDSNLFIPSEMEVETTFEEKRRINVWFFQDTSGSCSGHTKRFFDAARSLPEDRFDVRMFCFDTRVYETTLESGRLYGFGGTTFTCIEFKIQELMAKEKVGYPEAVFVITDGYGNSVKPQKPEKWYWFLTPSHSTYCIPKESHTFKLTDYE